jgi:hypothetical protein
VDEQIQFTRTPGRRPIASAIILLCLILALPPFFGFQYSFYVGEYDLAVFRTLVPDVRAAPIIGSVLTAILSVSEFPSRVIASVFPIEGVTIFAGEGLVTPKPLVTVVFWLTMAFLIFTWMRRATREAAPSSAANPNPNS